MYNSLSFGLLRQKVVDTTGMLTSGWVRWMSNSLVPAVNNTTPLSIPGPFTDDAAAQAGGVPLNGIYYVSNTQVHVRLT